MMFKKDCFRAGTFWLTTRLNLHLLSVCRPRPDEKGQRQPLWPRWAPKAPDKLLRIFRICTSISYDNFDAENEHERQSDR